MYKLVFLPIVIFFFELIQFDWQSENGLQLKIDPKKEQQQTNGWTI